MAIDEEIRLAARQKASEACKGKERRLLLLQHAFGAFQQKLSERLRATLWTPPKELSFAAENPGENLGVKSYYLSNQRPKDNARARKFLFLR